ncbi:MAG: hypothetical protein PVG90_01905 [Bacillota bacterium]|jgi:hypothetical protein
MKRVPKSAIFLIVAIIGGSGLLTGCNREFSKQTLDQKRLGVYLETEKGDRDTLNNALTAWLSQTLPTTGVTAIPATNWEGLTKTTQQKIQQTYQLDYLIVVQLNGVKVVGFSPKLDLSNKNVNLKLGSKCQLTLGYRMIDLWDGKVLLTGQTPGTAEKTTDFHLELKKIAINLSTDESEQLIAAAMINAIQNSTLLKY